MGMREEFEAWASSPDFGLRAGHFVKGDDGEYENYPTECYWKVWQASRAVLVIELPVFPEDDKPSTWVANSTVNVCRNVIHAAGVLTK